MRAKRDFFSRIKFFFRDGSNEVSHAPGRVREVCFVPDTQAQTGTEKPENTNRYRDKNFSPLIQLLLNKDLVTLGNIKTGIGEGRFARPGASKKWVFVNVCFMFHNRN